MNGNYEFVKRVAQDKQSAFMREAEAHRKASSTFGAGREWSKAAFVAPVRFGFRRFAERVAHAFAGQVAGWKAFVRGPGGVTR